MSSSYENLEYIKRSIQVSFLTDVLTSPIDQTCPEGYSDIITYDFQGFVRKCSVILL